VQQTKETHHDSFPCQQLETATPHLSGLGTTKLPLPYMDEE